MLKLDKRLEAIISEIDGEIIADIGCDHGKVVVSAILQGRAKKAIAIDISNKSLHKTVELARQHNVLDKIECTKGDGLSPLKIIPNLIIIAGMGAKQIVDILGAGFIDTKYILVPHQDTALLRQYLMNNNFNVIKDYTVQAESFFYDIIITRKGVANYKSNQIYTGKNMPESPYYLNRLKLRKEALNKILEGVDNTEKLSRQIKEEWEEIKSAMEDKRCN